MHRKKSNNEAYFTENLRIEADCIITAAGFSSRMGRWKAELETSEGISFLENTIRITSLCRRVLLVGGYRFRDLQRLIPADFKGTILENRDFQKGMLSTVQRALDYVEGYFFVMPIDMPLVKPEAFAEVYSLRRPDKIVRPSWEGKPGHPVLFSPSWKRRLGEAAGDSPSAVVRREDQILIPWSDDSVVRDMDTPEVYERYRDLQA